MRWNPTRTRWRREFRGERVRRVLRHRGGHSVECGNAGPATSRVISSLAGHRGLPGAAGYCATKAALTRLVEGMRPDWALAGIGATIVHPGYVRSEMTDRNRFRMPFLHGDRPGGPIDHPRDPPP